MKIRKSNHPNGLGTSFSFITFSASVNELIEKFGNPTYNHPENYDDKVTREWELELSDGTLFTIYDWKEYRYFDDDEKISWHVGTDYNVPNRESQDEKVRKAIKSYGF